MYRGRGLREWSSGRSVQSHYTTCCAEHVGRAAPDQWQATHPGGLTCRNATPAGEKGSEKGHEGARARTGRPATAERRRFPPPHPECGGNLPSAPVSSRWVPLPGPGRVLDDVDEVLAPVAGDGAFRTCRYGSSGDGPDRPWCRGSVRLLPGPAGCRVPGTGHGRFGRGQGEHAFCSGSARPERNACLRWWHARGHLLNGLSTTRSPPRPARTSSAEPRSGEQRLSHDHAMRAACS